METRLIQLDALQAHPHNPRSEQALTANTATLQASLQRGVHKPLTVRSTGGGTYEILAGHRTATVARSLGFSELPCCIVDVDDVDALKIVVGDNAAIESITTSGVIQSIESLLSIGVSKKEVFQIVGLSKARVNDLLKLGSMEPSLLAALESSELAGDGKLTATTLLAASRVDGFATVDAAKALELISGKSRKDACAAIERWIKGEKARKERVAAHARGESAAEEPKVKVRAPRTPAANKANKAEGKAKTANTKADNTAVTLACRKHAADLGESGFYRFAPEADIIVGRVLTGSDVDEAGALLEALQTLTELGIIMR